MSVYHVRNWHRYQRSALRSILKSRRARAVRAICAGEEPEKIGRPISLDTISVSTGILADGRAVGEQLGRDGRWADAMMLRVLLHVARHGALSGEFYLSPRTRRGHAGDTPARLLGVSPRFAGVVLDALLGNGFIIEGPSTLPQWIRTLTDESTLNDEAARSERRPERGSERVPSGDWHSRGRDTRDRRSPLPPTGSGAPREATPSPSADAPGRRGARGDWVPGRTGAA